MNVVVVGWSDSTAAVNTITDKSGNIYTRAVGPTAVAGALSQSIYYAKNIVAAAAGANVVTVTFSVATQYPDIRILEYSGEDLNSPVDATAAGDAFVGAFAVALAEGRSPAEALRWGNAAGALAVTRAGAQPSLPSRAQVEALL